MASNALYGGQTCDSLCYDRRLSAENPSITESSPFCSTIPKAPLARAFTGQQIIDVDRSQKTTLSAGGHRLDPVNDNLLSPFFRN